MSILTGPTKIAFGFGLGVMAARTLGRVAPAFRGLGRPLLKAAVKSGMILAGDARIKLAGFREVLAEVAQEAGSELSQAAAETPGAPPPSPREKAAAAVM